MIAIAVSKISTFFVESSIEVSLFHIGAERDEDSHRNRQGVEHLPHRGDDGHPGEVFEVWNQEIFHACHRARSCHGVDRDDHGEDHEDRHHKF